MSQNHSSNIQLEDRVLWFDGDSTLSEQQIVQQRLTGFVSNGMYVDVMSPTIEKYNANVSRDKQICVKQEIRDIIVDWVIPENYKTLNVVKYVNELAYDYCIDHDYIKDIEGIPQISARANNILKRVHNELRLYKKYNLFNLLQTLIFIINTLQANNVVWGVGRGSGVSSFVLYLLEVHDVDSVEYNLSIEDFLHD